jgi:hypothetical protein
MGQFRKRRKRNFNRLLHKDTTLLLLYSTCSNLWNLQFTKSSFVAKNKSWWDNKCTEHMLVMLHASWKKIVVLQIYHVIIQSAKEYRYGEYYSDSTLAACKKSLQKNCTHALLHSLCFCKSLTNGPRHNTLYERSVKPKSANLKFVSCSTPKWSWWSLYY